MSEDQVSVRRTVSWSAIAFSVVLAAIIGVRLEQAALTLMVGVVCGVAASIPAGYLVVVLLRRRDARRQVRERQTPQPPVVVVAPSAAPQLSPGSGHWPSAYPAPLPAQRKFAVIGEEGIEEDEFDFWQE